MIGGRHVLEEVATCRHETLSLDVTVRTLAGLGGQHHLHGRTEDVRV